MPDLCDMLDDIDDELRECDIWHRCDFDDMRSGCSCSNGGSGHKHHKHHDCACLSEVECETSRQEALKHIERATLLIEKAVNLAQAHVEK